MMTPQQSASILSRMFGYQGPTDQKSIDQFLAANPAAAARMGKYQETMNKMVSGKPIRGFQEGGVVPKNTVIAGQPHRLAYVNPQEEQMLKAAGGAGVPSHGGIPAYFRLGPASLAGAGTSVTDPTTGTVYTSDGSKWATDQVGGSYDRRDGPSEAFEALIPTPQPVTMSTEDITPLTPEQQQLQQLQAGQQQLALQAGQPIRRAEVAQIDPTTGMMSATAGQITAPPPLITPQTISAQTVAAPTVTPAATMEAMTTAPQVQAEVAKLQAAQGEVTLEALAQAQQQLTSAVSNLKAAQGVGILMQNPVQRKIEAGEMVEGGVADAQKAAVFAEQIQAAEATPTKQATVQGQLEDLMRQFEQGNVPAWAAGAMRTATATMAARGLGASSLAGQAVVQAAMESALPIAMADAQTRAQFEAQNLSNRQQRAILAAQQRAAFIGQEFDQEFQARVLNASKISDIANMNFTAEQQVALENSRIANTVNLQNLNNRQAMVIAEASALANLDMANLNNRQQAAVQNAQAFLQMDLTNLSNQQQAAILKTQLNTQALFSDQAAENAARQFNASSENQTNQFFASLSAQVSQFNASQSNAIAQFNAGQEAAAAQFNAEVKQQRDLFNAQQSLIIEQANAQWRQNVTTLNTAAQNEANMEEAKTLNALSSASLANVWQRERDLMSYAFTSSESKLDRDLSTVLADKNLEEVRKQIEDREETAKWAFGMDLLFG